jgi:hypothetical protein
LEAAGGAVSIGISGNARAAVDKAIKTSAIQAQVCHEMLCDNTTIASANAREWHEFFKMLYLITWRYLIPLAPVLVSSYEKENPSKYDTMLRLLTAIKLTSSDALTAVDDFVLKPNRSRRKTAIRSVESVCDALGAWRIA